jgi:Leucine-rich repeat (LRR) protein
LPEWIGRLKNLSSLNLCCNKLERLPESIGGLKNLSSLNLYGNELKRLPEWIGRLKNLSSLSLCCNSNLDFDDALRKLSKLKNLSSLDLYGNELKRLPESIKKLALTLKYLYLGGNPVWNDSWEMKKIKSWFPNTYIYWW